MISTSHGGKLKHAVAYCLRHWIPNLEVPKFETTGWLKGQLSLSSFRGRSMEYQELPDSWELNGKKETVSS